MKLLLHNTTTALPFAFLLVLAPDQQEPSRGPLRDIEIVVLLHAGVTSPRLRDLVSRHGIDFDPSPETLEILRAAGADEAFLLSLGSAPRRSPAAPGVAAGPGKGATLPSPYEPRLVLVPGGARGDLYFSRFEVTNRQYRAFCERSGRPHPSVPYWGTPDNLPVVNVTWYDAVTFCRWLSLETGRQYRLPTGAEWEHAARGGLTGRLFPWGDAEPRSRSCFAHGALCPVGSHGRNGYGLHDMAGSVAEWTLDRVEPGAKARVLRGGSWATPENRPELLEISRRDRLDPDKQRNDVGFRVVREP